MVGLITANIASVGSDLDAGLDIADSSNDTSDLNKSSDHVSSKVSHLVALLFGVRSKDEEDIVLSEEFRRELLSF